MKLPFALAAAAGLAAATLPSAPARAVTAYQLWARGHGYEVSSIARGTTYLDDLEALGLIPPPEPVYRYHRERRRAYPDNPEY